MKLNVLLAELNIPLSIAHYSVEAFSQEISLVTSDSRQIASGALFLALKGHQCHGNTYIPEAIKRGACAIFEEADTQGISFIGTIPLIKIQNLSQITSYIGRVFYQNIHLPMAVIGVTGTNGKTTTTHLVAKWLMLLGHKAAVMGTVGNGVIGDLVTSNNTTSSAIEVQANLAKYNQEGMRACAMEVSSHGLTQFRVEAVPFSVVAFLNLSRDHLDYHGSMQNYEAAKARLFDSLDSKHQVINIDDEIGSQWFTKHPSAIAISIDPQALSKTQPEHYVVAESIHYTSLGAEISVMTSWGNGLLTSRLLGEFNVYNILTALGILLSLGYSLSDLLAQSQFLTAVDGRMELFTHPKHATVVVDYAHTPDALEKALIALKTHQQGRIWCIFGCGGDRDKGKRPLMGAIAQTLSDHVIITDDNPRTEDRNAITNDIIAGMNGLDYKIIHDRAEAIQYAITHADKDDLILVAGKGHEDYQIIGHSKFDYSDRALMSKLYNTGLRMA